jgi:hypothetical protein
MAHCNFLNICDKIEKSGQILGGKLYFPLKERYALACLL